MHRRLTAIFLVLSTVVGSLVGAAAPAHAALPFHCISGMSQVQCGVDVPNDRELTSIVWYVNDVLYDNSGSSATTSFTCNAGQTVRVRFVMVLSPPEPPGGEQFTGSMNVLCLGAAISNVYVGCSSGGSRLQCSVTYAGGTPPVTIRWTVNGVLRTFFNDQWWLDTSCRAPSEMSISVTVSDINGGQTVSGFCFCHGGPLD